MPGYPCVIYRRMSSDGRAPTDEVELEAQRRFNAVMLNLLLDEPK